MFLSDISLSLTLRPLTSLKISKKLMKCDSHAVQFQKAKVSQAAQGS